jgi:hypothetical protein
LPPFVEVPREAAVEESRRRSHRTFLSRGVRYEGWSQWLPLTLIQIKCEQMTRA